MDESKLAISTLEPISLKNIDGGSIEAEFQEKMTEVVEYLSESKNKGTCKIKIELTFKPHERRGFVESTAAVTSSIPVRKRANILMARDGRIVQDITSADASEPGLFPREHQTQERQS